MIAYGNKVKGVFTDKRDGSSSSLNIVFKKVLTLNVVNVLATQKSISTKKKSMQNLKLSTENLISDEIGNNHTKKRVISRDFVH